MTDRELCMRPYRDLCAMAPYVPDFFDAMALPPPGQQQTLADWAAGLDPYLLEQKGVEREQLAGKFELFMRNMRERYAGRQERVESVSILGGHDKSGAPEQVRLDLHAGDVVSIVGPTGSGKSRLLADMEWLAQGDTPTGRVVLVNGQKPPASWRLSIEHKLVAQLSQNMNFVMDLTVDAFIQMHMESRMTGQYAQRKAQILREANRLAGEPISLDTPVTALSGGQSRALMIADTAYLSSSPVVLIDEIENAGIDRGTAVELLVRREKIVLIATHDPVLALRAPRRVVIRNGGIRRVLHTTEGEKALCTELESLNARLMACRDALRRGEQLA